MDELLAQGTAIRIRSHRLDCQVGALIGAGGQGEVYRVLIRTRDSRQELALKWYYPHWATPQQFEALSRLVGQGPPSRRFLWPIDLAVAADRPGFGYVMPIRPSRYVACVDIMAGRRPINFRQALLAALQLADCFLTLHARGLCYRDISFGNVFIDPDTGDVLVVDNDNVAFDGAAPPGIRGTGSFVAPEIVRNEAFPSVATDLYSLSVLLFYLLVMHHPLEGGRLATVGVMGRDEALAVYGRQPVFIFDPQDHSNTPDPRHDPNALVFWPLYPDALRTLFVQAFTIGLHHPGERVRESQWRATMAQLLDLLVVCDCGADVFVQLDGRPVTSCWSCSSATGGTSNLPRLILDPATERRVVALHENKQLYPHHIGPTRFDYQFPLARVERHPQVPSVLGLRNLTSATWTGTRADGEMVPVPPRRTLQIEPGTSVSFGTVSGLFTSA